MENAELKILDVKLTSIREMIKRQNNRIAEYEKRVDLQDKFIKTVQIDGDNAKAVFDTRNATKGVRKNRKKIELL